MPNTSIAPIPLSAPNQPTRITAYPPEPALDIENNFQVRSTGPRNLPPRNSSPISYFYLFFTVNVMNHIKPKIHNLHLDQEVMELVTALTTFPDNYLVIVKFV
ncbi:hypothetical protein J6590_020748 [Homalodisca vitripennis]|nr:hypothetical protein J6590_020748 [Homalodisca vitripennis]